MVSWIARCFGASSSNARLFPEAPASAETQAEQVPPTGTNAASFAERSRQDAMLAFTMETDRSVEAEPAEAVNSLEDARQLILKLKARVRELEGSAGQNVADTLLSLRHIRLPEQEARPGPSPGSVKRGNEAMPSIAESVRDITIEAREEQKSVPHLFQAYTKQELVETLSKACKPAAAVLLQAVCEEDIGSVPPALLLDVDPAVGDAVAAAPELMAGLRSGGSGGVDFAQLASLERLPNYLRLRLYMMQACGARPMLAYATATARSLFKARTDRQLQYVLEGQVQQDAMLGMLLQEMLDEMLSAPVTRSSAAANLAREGDRSTIVMHSLSHFVNTSNPKVFPFVPVTMRGCGYRKSSGEVVPCIIFEFSPDSNQGAFLEHLQRDYTMMGHISAIITLFTLKGDVLHQNAGSIAYYGFQRRSALDNGRRGSAHGGRNSKRTGVIGSPNDLDASAAAWLRQNETPILTRLFQYAPPDALEGMLESMVQGGVWRSILPVPATLAASGRPQAILAGAGDLLAPGGAVGGVPPGASFLGPDPDNIFTMDGLAFTGANVMSFARQSADRSIGNRADVFEGSFALGTTAGGGGGGGLGMGRAQPRAAGPGSQGHGMVRSMRALNVVPEQSQEGERMSFVQHRPPGRDAVAGLTPARGGLPLQSLLPSSGPVAMASNGAPAGAGGVSTVAGRVARTGEATSGRTSHTRLSPRSVRSSFTSIADGLAKHPRAPRRSTTFSAAPSATDRTSRPSSGCTTPIVRMHAACAAAASAAGGAGSFTNGVVVCSSSPRLTRIRRRSGLPIGLEASPADALSHSTWGLFGSAAYDGRLDKAGTGRDSAVTADSGHTGDNRVSGSRRFECAVQARLAAGKALGISSSTTAAAAAEAAAGANVVLVGGGGSGSAAVQMERTASVSASAGAAGNVPSSAHGGLPSDGASAAQRSEAASPALLSPSHGSAVDQWQQWQYRHSQWQDALQSQASQPSQTSLGNHLLPSTRLSSQPPQTAAAGHWLLHHQQHVGLSQSSSFHQSSVASDSRRGGGGGMAATGALLDTGPAAAASGGGGGGTSHRHSSVESVPRRQRSVAFGGGFGDCTPSPTARSTPTPSAGSLVSPQPSAHQHTDRDLMGACTTLIASMGSTPLLDPSQVRPQLSSVPPTHTHHLNSPGYGQPSRFLATSPPAGSPVQEAAPPGGARGSAAAAAAAGVAESSPTARLQSSSPAASGVSGVVSRSIGGSVDAARPSGPGGGVGCVRPLDGGNGAPMRRAPMRQSERSNPNLVLPRSGASSTTANAVKSATSFSFGSKAGHPQRPLVRMMSFLNGGHGVSVVGTSGQHLNSAQQAYNQSQALNTQPYSAHSGAHHRQILRRAASGQYFQTVEPVLRTGSSRAPNAAGDGSIGTLGLSSQSGSRFPTSAFLGSSVTGHRRPSARQASAAMLLPSGIAGVPGHPVIEDESSSLAALTTMGASREAMAAAGSTAPNGSGPGLLAHGAWLEHEGAAQTYHEITATPFLDPVSKAQVVMVVQTDVTARVQLERRLADVMEAEHKLLENIFPRHVLEYIAHSAAVNQERASQFNLRMLSAMPDLTKTATDHERVTILFADIVGFTSMCKEVPAKAVMKFLNDLYTRFDTLLDIYGVYKVETIGDCYMVAGGLISKDADGFAAVRKDSCDNLQAWRVLSFAKAMLRDAQKVLLPTTQEPVKLRVGIHTGPVVSGVVGTRMPRFCLFGDTINTASRMESTCPYGRIQVSAATHALVTGEDWEPTGGVQVKGKGIMETYLLKHSPGLALPTGLASASLSTPGGPDALAQPAHGSTNLARGALRMQHNAAAAATVAVAAAVAVATASHPGTASALGTGSARATCSGFGSGANAGGAGSTVGNASLAHGVVSAVAEEVPGAASLAGGGTRADGGGVAAAATAAAAAAAAGAASARRNSRPDSSGGKNPSFLFNTVW